MTTVADDIWAILRELAQSQKETDRKFQETHLMFKETDLMFKETNLKFKETDRKLRELSSLFTTQWGKLIEALVRPGLLELFRQRGIAVNETLQRDRVRRDGREMEIDVMLVDGDVVVPVEVKTTLKIEDVRYFQRRMKDFLFFFPKYRGYRIFGAVAAVHIDEQADRYAYRQGLFVLTLGRNGLARILNDEKFVPRDLAVAALDPESD
jgi:hypothetical protein